MARASVFSLENGQDWKWSDDVERLNESKKERKAWEYSCYGFFFKKKKQCLHMHFITT